MIRKTAFAFALVLAIAPQTFAAGWLKSISAAQKTAGAKNQLILVDLFAQWCGWCHRFEQEVYPSAAFQNATDDMVLLRLDIEDNGEGTAFSRKYGITQLPTFMVLAPDLSIAGIIRGYSPPAQFAAQIQETRGKYAEFLTRVKDEPNYGHDYAKRLALAKEFVSRSAYTKAEPRLRKLTTEKGVPAGVRDEAYYQLAIIYTLSNRYDEGLKTIRQLNSISKSGESVESSRLLAAQIYIQQGNLLSAANEYRNFKATFPKSPRIADVNSVLPQIEARLAAMGTK